MPYPYAFQIDQHIYLNSLLPIFSFLQRLTEDLEYASLLDRAAELTDPCEQMQVNQGLFYDRVAVSLGVMSQHTLFHVTAQLQSAQQSLLIRYLARLTNVTELRIWVGKASQNRLEISCYMHLITIM